MHVFRERYLVLANLLEELAELIALGLLLAHLVQLVLVEHALNLDVKAVVLTKKGLILLVLFLGEWTVITLCEFVNLVELDQNLLMALLDFLFCLSHFLNVLKG